MGLKNFSLISFFRPTTSHESGIAWLEKELHSLQREKQKLEREKEKYLDREQRLEKIRTAMRNQQQKEITVKTSNGEEFKFGGISENFTRKLFEWEERRNIAPESSTIGKTPARTSQTLVWTHTCACMNIHTHAPTFLCAIEHKILQSHVCARILKV